MEDKDLENKTPSKMARLAWPKAKYGAIIAVIIIVVVNILFSNVYPVSLSSLQYTNDSTDTEYLSATATFQYQIYDFENLKKP